MSYEQVADQDKGGREAMRLVSHKIRDAVNKPNPPGIDVQKGVRLRGKMKRGRLVPQDIERSLYQPRRGLGDAATEAVKVTTEAATGFLKLLTGDSAAKEEEAKSKKMPLVLIGGAALLTFLTYILFFRNTRSNPESYSVKAAKHVSKALANTDGNIEATAQEALADFQAKHKAPKKKTKKKSKSRRR